MIDQNTAIALVVWMLGFIPLIIGVAKANDKILFFGVCWIMIPAATLVGCLFVALLITAVTGITLL